MNQSVYLRRMDDRWFRGLGMVVQLLKRVNELYFAAVRVGIKRDYQAMAKIFSEVIQKTVTGPAKS